MSRRKGHRDLPASERRAIRERYATKKRPGRAAAVDRLKGPRPISNSRRWAAVLVGTVASTLAFSLLANAIVEAGDGHDSNAMLSAGGAAVAVGLLLLSVGFVSRAGNPLRSAAIWSVATVVVFVAAAYAAREVATAFVLAVGVGASWVMRFEDGVHVRSWRLWTALGLAAYTKLVYVLSPGLALVAVPLLPVAGVAIIDSVAERRRQREASALA